MLVDGDGAEWEQRGHSAVLAESRGPVREVRSTHDEEYLYLRLTLDEPYGTMPVTVGFDVRPGANVSLPGRAATMPEADVALSLDMAHHATLRQAAWTDPIAWQYGVAHPFVPVRRTDLRKGSGVWVTPRLILNKPFTVPDTGVKRPTEIIDIGRLRWGTANPAQAGFDDRVLVASRGRTVEVRLPWMMLTYSDPSSHQVIVPHDDATVTSQRTGRIGITTAADSQVLATDGYDWDDWNTVTSHERRKVGWDTLVDAFRSASTSVR